MNKELEALEIICGELVEMDLLFIDANGTNQQKWFQTQAYKNNIKFQKKYGSPTSIIETALKRLESVDRVGEMFCVNVDKKLKALEIIKEKRVDVQLLKDSKNFNDYNWCVHTKDRALTQEKYDILKEILE